MSTALSSQQEQFTKSASEQSLGISHPVIYKTVLGLLEQKQITRGHLLDFGSGQGDFLKTVAASFQFTLHAVDLMFTPMSGVNWYVQDLNRPLQFKDDQFDVITGIEVIEHLENPRRMVRELFRSLKSGGRCFVSTPNNESWRAIVSYVARGHFVAFTDSSYPAHITALNALDLQRIFSEAGFVDIEIHYTNHGQIPRWTSLSWQSLGSWLKGRRYSDNLVISARKP